MVLEADLRQIIRDEPARVVWVVGTGVPQGALRGTPSAPHTSWAGLLRSGLQRICDLGRITPEELADHERLLGHDRLNSWLLVAEAVVQGLGAPGDGEFRVWLRNTVGEFEKHIADRAVLDVLADLQHRGGLLATTNYDHLLENVTGLRPVTWRTPADVERALRGHEPQILHLHGDWRSPDSIVLGIRSYDEVARDPHARAVLTALRTSYTFVFVGCGAGLHDPNIGSFLSWSATVFGGSEYRHFRLCRENELAALRREHPAGQRIFPISYGNDHTDLAPFLRSLLAVHVTPGTSPTETAPTTTAPRPDPKPVANASSATTATSVLDTKPVASALTMTGSNTILAPTTTAPAPTPGLATTPVLGLARPRGPGSGRGWGRPSQAPTINGTRSGSMPGLPVSAPRQSDINSTDLILDVPALVGRTRAEVDTILGRPEQWEAVNPSKVGPDLKCTYHSGKVEIVYLAGRADWITVNDLQDIEFSPRSIGRFGFPILKPTDFNHNVIRWIKLSGLLEVLLWPGQGGGCHFLYVKAFSP